MVTLSSVLLGLMGCGFSGRNDSDHVSLLSISIAAAELEDAANMLGANRWHALRRVALPLVFSAVLAGFILSFLEAIALFCRPAIIGCQPRPDPLLTNELTPWLLRLQKRLG